MGREATRADLERYATVLRGLGLSAADVRALHGLPAGAPMNLGTLREADAFEGPITVEGLETGLRSAIADADLGFDAPRRYWNELPTMQLRSVVAEHGGTFAVVDGPADRTRPPIVDGTTLEVTDADGGTARRTTVEYPDTALDDDNYPALLAAIEADLFYDTNLTFARLTTDGDDWLFALVDERRLDALRDRYGDRIAWADRPLLAEYQPDAYDRDVDAETPAGADVPPALVPDDPASSTTGATLSRSTATFEDVTESVDADAANEAFDHGAGGPTVDELVAAEDPTAAVEDGTVAASDGGTVVATDAEIDELFATMDETTLDTSQDVEGPPGPAVEDASFDVEGADRTAVGVERVDSTAFGVETADAPPTPTEAVDRSPDAGAHALDEAFEALGREAARSRAGPRTDGDDDAVTSGDIIEELEHENVGDDATVEAGFVWVDAEELTPVPGAVYEAAGTEL